MNKDPGLKQIAIETTLTLPTSQLLRSFSSLEGVCHAGTHVACSRQRTAEAEPGGYRGGGLNSLVNADEVYTCIYSNRLQDSFKTRHPQLSTGCMFGCSFLCQVVSTQRI